MLLWAWRPNTEGRFEHEVERGPRLKSFRLLKPVDNGRRKRPCCPPQPMFPGAVARSEEDQAKHTRKCCRVFDLTADETERGPLSCWAGKGHSSGYFQSPHPHSCTEGSNTSMACRQFSPQQVSPLLAQSQGPAPCCRSWALPASDSACAANAATKAASQY